MDNNKVITDRWTWDKKLGLTSLPLLLLITMLRSQLIGVHTNWQCCVWKKKNMKLLIIRIFLCLIQLESYLAFLITLFILDSGFFFAAWTMRMIVEHNFQLNACYSNNFFLINRSNLLKKKSTPKICMPNGLVRFLENYHHFSV